MARMSDHCATTSRANLNGQLQLARHWRAGIHASSVGRGIDNTTVNILYECIQACDRNADSGPLIVNVQATQCPH